MTHQTTAPDVSTDVIAFPDRPSATVARVTTHDTPLVTSPPPPAPRRRRSSDGRRRAPPAAHGPHTASRISVEWRRKRRRNRRARARRTRRHRPRCMEMMISFKYVVIGETTRDATADGGGGEGKRKAIDRAIDRSIGRIDRSGRTIGANERYCGVKNEISSRRREISSTGDVRGRMSVADDRRGEAKEGGERTRRRARRRGFRFAKRAERSGAERSERGSEAYGVWKEFGE